MSDEFEPFGETCDRDDCDHPTPWDMSAITFDDETGYCSPECALAVLGDDAPERVTLHDPQLRVDRGELGLREEIIGFIRTPEGEAAAAEDAIREFKQMFPVPFTADEGDA